MNLWEVWYADFPYEDDASKSSDRPVIVLSIVPLCILSVKVTKHPKRDSDEFDTEIVDWQQAGLAYPSVARLSKTITLDPSKFRRKIGELSDDDKTRIANAYINYLIKTGTVPLSETNGDSSDMAVNE